MYDPRSTVTKKRVTTTIYVFFSVGLNGRQSFLELVRHYLDFYSLFQLCMAESSYGDNNPSAVQCKILNVPSC